MSNLITPGFYRAVAVPAPGDGGEVWAQFGRTKEGNPQVVIMFALLDEGPFKGRRLAWYGYFTDRSGDRTVESLRLIGFKSDELLDLPKGPLSQEVSVEIQTNDYDGKKTSRIAWINAPGGARLADPMKPNELRAFSGKFKAKLKSKPVVDGPKASAPAPAAASPSEDPEPPEDKGDDPWAAGNEPPPASVPDDPIPF